MEYAIDSAVAKIVDLDEESSSDLFYKYCVNELLHGKNLTAELSPELNMRRTTNRRNAEDEDGIGNNADDDDDNDGLSDAQEVKFGTNLLSSDTDEDGVEDGDEILLQEIHHRVKNNLQMVSGLLSLQARHIDNEKTRMIYLESESRVMSMALIHENLYRTKDLGRISFSDYVRDLSRNISSTYDHGKGKVEIFFEMEPASLVMDTAIPAGLVINELLTNAFQHAFPEDRDGMITIGFQVERENNYTLTVKDNGVGISVDRGLDGYSSLGLSLVKTLVELLGGQVEVSHQDGTIFTITFKEYLEAGTEMH